jgi:hypothetical protein
MVMTPEYNHHVTRSNRDRQSKRHIPAVCGAARKDGSDKRNISH